MNYISDNIKRLRKLKNLSQKEVAMSIEVAQGQYSLIENGKVVPTIPTLDKIAKVFDVSLSELVKQDNENLEELNLPLLEKIRLIDQLEQNEKDSLMTIIDIAISRKKLKDNLSGLLAS